MVKKSDVPTFTDTSPNENKNSLSKQLIKSNSNKVIPKEVAPRFKNGNESNQ